MGMKSRSDCDDLYVVSGGASILEHMKWLTGGGLLVSAFAPIIAVLALLRMSQLGWVGWVAVGISVFSLGFLVLVFRELSEIQSKDLATQEVRHADERVLAFTSSYIVPVAVAVFAPSGVYSLIAMLVVLALMLMIYVRAGLYHLNPVLAVVGFRLYEITRINGSTVMLLSRASHLPQDGSMEVRYLSDDVAIHWERRK